MKKAFTLFLTIFLALILASCQNTKTYDSTKVNEITYNYLNPYNYTRMYSYSLYFDELQKEFPDIEIKTESNIKYSIINFKNPKSVAVIIYDKDKLVTDCAKFSELFNSEAFDKLKILRNKFCDVCEIDKNAEKVTDINASYHWLTNGDLIKIEYDEWDAIKNIEKITDSPTKKLIQILESKGVI